MGHLSVPLSSEDQAALHQLAAANHSSDSEYAAERLRDYLRFELDQVAKIHAGLAAADRGDFVPDAEMDRFFPSLGRRVDPLALDYASQK